MKYQPKQWKITGIMPLMVFFLLSVCLMTLLLTGVRIYRNTVEQGESRFLNRTAVQYLTTRVHQADCRNQLSVESFDGIKALVFREEIDGEIYKTMVYCHEGYLKELFCAEDGHFRPSDGEKLFALEDLQLQLEDSLLQIQVTLPDGVCRQISLHLRSREVTVP
jgi:hypothetical protein